MAHDQMILQLAVGRAKEDILDTNDVRKLTFVKTLHELEEQVRNSAILDLRVLDNGNLLVHLLEPNSSEVVTGHVPWHADDGRSGIRESHSFSLELTRDAHDDLVCVAAYAGGWKGANCYS